MKVRTVFMGSPEFALPTLQALVDQTKFVGVVTQPDRRAGRGKTLKPPPVKSLALELGLEVYQPDSLRTPGALDKLQKWNPDLIIVAAFGQILRENILNLAKFGCLNVHASLLPRWRGASPINAAILHGDEETGITIMKMDAGLDTGPILSNLAIPILPEDNAGILSEKLASLGADLLTTTLPAYISGELSPSPQDDEASTYAPMLSKQDGELDFSVSAENLARKVRAFDPWPGTFTRWKNQPLKILRAHPEPGKDMVPGSRTTHRGLPAIQTADGLLVIEKLQPAGKKAQDGKVFLNGARDWQQD